MFSANGLPWPCNESKKVNGRFCKYCGGKHIISCEDTVEHSKCPFQQIAHGLANLGFDAVLSDTEA